MRRFHNMRRCVQTGFLLLALCVPGVVSAIPMVDMLAVSLGGSLFRYDFTVSNPGPEDFVIVSVSDAPTADPLIPGTLVAPAGFIASYDSGLGFVDFIEDTSLFAAGSVTSGFSFQSEADTTAFFNKFLAVDDQGNNFEGNINRTAGTPGVVPDSGSTLPMACAGLLLCVAGGRIVQRRIGEKTIP